MTKVLKFLREFFLNALLLFLIFLMISLMYLNWTKGLNINSMPENFFGYDYIMKFVDSKIGMDYEIQGKDFAIPYKIAIKDGKTTHSIMYNESRVSSIYNTLMANVKDDVTYDYYLEKISLEEYMKATLQEKFVYLEFICPISAIINVDLEIFVIDVIAFENLGNVEIYIKSEFDFYKIIIPQMTIDYEINQTLNNEYQLFFSQNASANLISNTSFITNQVKFDLPKIDFDTKQKIISKFLYNLAITTSYETISKETIYVNEFSTISINNTSLEFQSTDPRGNIFNEQNELSHMQMIDFSTGIFDSIYEYIGSEITAQPFDVYYKESLNVVVLTGKINSIDINAKEPIGIFAFSSKGLSYCKINFLTVEQTQDKIMLAKTNLLDAEEKLILSYDLDGVADWKYCFYGR